MFDCHYDLLTYIYVKKENIDYLKNYYQKIYKENNITGGIFNLFFMTEKEMKRELNIEKEEIDIIEMLKTVKKILKEHEIVSKETKYIFGIEGLDYLRNIDDIDVLYDLGVRSTNIVWNNENKFGGGAKSNKECGLTLLGEELVKKLIEKNITIDLSHANEKTFWDIIKICREMKKIGNKPRVIASHSNCKALCNVPRNLTDEQIMAIKEFDGIIGVVAYKKFCSNDENLYNDKYKKKYLEHIEYIYKLLGGVDNISVATDDMSCYPTIVEDYENSNVFNIYAVKEEISALLEEKFNKEDIEKILYKNAECRMIDFYVK